MTTEQVGMSQNTLIKMAMVRLMKDGMTNKDDIYDHCVNVMGFKRPTVRRVAGELRKDLEEQLLILSSDIGKHGSS